MADPFAAVPYVTRATIILDYADGTSQMVPVLLEGRLTVDGPSERGPIIVWVRRG